MKFNIDKFIWDQEDEIEVLPIEEEVTTTANTMGVIRPLGTPEPLRQQFPKKTNKRKKKKLKRIAAQLESLT